MVSGLPLNLPGLGTGIELCWFAPPMAGIIGPINIYASDTAVKVKNPLQKRILKAYICFCKLEYMNEKTINIFALNH